MLREDNELLLKDLSGRLPYGVFCVGTTYELDDDGERYIPVKVKDTLTEIHNYKLETASVRLGLVSSCKLETVKPYLRPMSSMTEEEKSWFNKVVYDSMNIDNISASVYVADWLYSKHLDVHGLIPKGLALEVTPDNNPYKDV